MLYVFCMVVLIFPTKYEVILPGDTTSFQDQVAIEGYELSDISSIYVISYEPITLFQYSILTAFDLGQVFTPSAATSVMTLREKYDAAQIQKLSSYMISTIVAYQESNKEITYNFKGYAVTSILNAKRQIQVGDYIISINGIELTPNIDFTQFQQALTLNFHIIRDQEIIEVLHERSENDFGLSLYPIYEIVHAQPSIRYPGLDSLIGGPSGGMMMALSIYLALENQFYDIQIVGTGTIDIHGFIGSIGGLKEKYMTVKNDMDIMFIPSQQIDELSDIYDSRIVPINHIHDAVNYLKDYHA